jgi:large subunit ribosomal protein L19
MKSLDFVEQEILRRDLPPFRVGDAVRVHVRVKEGDKERIQVFEGLVIRRRGSGSGETFTVRKIASGVGVERIFPVQSQLVTKVEIKSRGFVRRSRLYYLRNLSGKKARLHSKVRDLSELVAPDVNDVDPNAEEVVVEAVEEVVETESAEESGRKLTGKARKRAKAKEKAERQAVKAVKDAELKKQREAAEAKEAEEAAKAEAEAEAQAKAEASAAEEAAVEEPASEETAADEEKKD